MPRAVNLLHTLRPEPQRKIEKQTFNCQHFKYLQSGKTDTFKNSQVYLLKYRPFFITDVNIVVGN